MLKKNNSLYFIDKSEKNHFLFQIISFGRNDNLKFIFNAKNQGTGIIYSSKDKLNTLVKPYGEITYHHDGHMHYKLPTYTESDTDDYKDRIKRTPLNQIKSWIPIIRYTCTDYGLNKKNTSLNQIFLPRNNSIFNGTPFCCIIWLGNFQNPNPQNTGPSEIIFRVNGIAQNIDLITWIYPISPSPKIGIVPNTNITFIESGNPVEIVDFTKKFLKINY